MFCGKDKIRDSNCFNSKCNTRCRKIRVKRIILYYRKERETARSLECDIRKNISIKMQNEYIRAHIRRINYVHVHRYGVFEMSANYVVRSTRT